MNRFCLGYRHCLYAGSFFFTKENVHDRTQDPAKIVPETGLERVLNVFSDPQPGEPSKELVSLMQFTSGSAFFGFIIGGLKSGTRAHENFIIANQQTKFISSFEARRKMHDTVFLAFVRGAIPWAIKAFLFTGIYSLCIIVIPAYRNKESLLEYFIGGALAGAIFRSYLGIKATLAGGLIGGVFTSLVGILTFLTSTSMSDIRDLQYSFYTWRREGVKNCVRDLIKDLPGNEYSSILDLREKRMKQADTGGYSTTENVYTIIPDSDYVSSSSEPTKNAIEVEDKKSNELISTPISVAGTEPKSTDK